MVSLALALSLELAAAEPVPVPAEVSTSLASLGAFAPPSSVPSQISGLARWVSPEGNRFVLESAGRAALFESSQSQSLVAGQAVNYRGPVTVIERGWRYRIGFGATVVENDGLHSALERTGSLRLPAGRHPLALSIFNASDEFSVAVEYAGPGISRGPIPPNALSHPETNAQGTVRWVPGLAYRCFEGEWGSLPLFESLVPVRTGVTAGFDLSAATRAERVALQFTGAISLPQEGNYTFWVSSDDGSRLEVGEPRQSLEVGPSLPLPPPPRIGDTATQPETLSGVWARAQGRVIEVWSHGETAEVVLRTAMGRIYAHLAQPPGDLSILEKAQLGIQGIVLPDSASTSSKAVGVLFVPSAKQVEWLEVSTETWDKVPTATIHDLTTNGSPSAPGALLRLRVHAEPEGRPGWYRLRDETGQTTARFPSPFPEEAAPIEVLVASDEASVPGLGEGPLWRPAELSATGAVTGELPVLTTVRAVHELSRSRAKTGRLVKVRGSVTCAWPDNFVLQDSTRGVFVNNGSGDPPEPREVGEILEVEGLTDPGDFAPIIRAQRIQRLGRGPLPTPITPTWDEVLNGSMDCQYVELEGTVAAVNGSRIGLIMRGGRVPLDVHRVPSERLLSLENSLVRLRGCMLAAWDATTHQFRNGELVLEEPSFKVIRPPAASWEATPRKAISDLYRFNPEANAQQRIRVGGQVQYLRAGQFFLSEEGHGLRCLPKSEGEMVEGDWVEVAGYCSPQGRLTVLLDAETRRLSSANLGLPKPLNATNLMSLEHDATRVVVEARLVGQRSTAVDRLLDLQLGPRIFQAILPKARGALRPIPLGSTLRLTGVYCGNPGSRTATGDFESFDLLLRGAGDVRVIASPPWWSLRHTLLVFGGLLLVIVLAFLWIRALRRSVDDQTRALRVEVEERRKAEFAASAARETAEAASRAKSQFLAVMSHEIRTPMNAMIGMSSLLRESSLNPEQRSYTETICRSGKLLLAVLNDILDYSKFEAGHLQLEHHVFEFESTVYAVLEMVADSAQSKGLELLCELDPSVPGEVRGDDRRFQQVLLNLLSNAVKFTAAGEISARFSCEPTPEGKLRITGQLSDTGIGLAAGVADRLFKPFTQADASTTRKFGGTGLGLAICKRLTEAMGGGIDVQSQPDQGSTFRFQVVFEPGHPAAAAAPNPPTLVAPGTRVLVVDDNRSHRALLERQLQRLGIDSVALAASSGEALKLLDAARDGAAPFHLAIVDQPMPGVDGTALARTIRAHPNHRHLPLLVLTSVPAQGTPAEVRDALPEVSLVKPVRPTLLRQSILRLLNPSVAASPRPSPVPSPAAPPAPLRVLLAEDNAVNQMVARHLLRKLGLECEIAVDGAAAVRMNEAHPFDLILMDCQMPVLDGYQATQQIRARESALHLPRTCIAAMTANAMPGDRDQCLQVGMDHYLAKPVALSDLEALVGSITHRRTSDAVPSTAVA